MTTKLYDLDFYGWALRQADLLRNEDYADLDRDNLIIAPGQRIRF